MKKKIGLLKPSARSDSNYRLYSSKDVQRIEKIASYREAGLSLESIADILDSNESESATVLEERLINLNKEISQLRQQQRVVEMLGHNSLIRTAKTMNKEQ
ncbi:MerR family transcriptional regulator [Shewanella sp. KX20019]|uniref:MerR family transcriptional regulator n=1 Tax=Shewanella sp. KX20019 TaxID=2803864 RepID=UPI003075B0F1